MDLNKLYLNKIKYSLLVLYNDAKFETSPSNVTIKAIKNTERYNKGVNWLNENVPNWGRII
jgi:hypothetical protein